jgi:hypothetical protein
MDDFNPGTVEVTRVELISYDGNTRRDLSSNYVYGFEINQSMDAVAYSGSINILDSSNVLEGMPIRGEETLNLTLVGMDFKTEVFIAARVHRVSNIMPRPSSNAVTYTIHFVSKQSFNASTRKILTSYLNTPDAMAHDMFTKGYAKLRPADIVDPKLKKSKIPLPYETKVYDLIKDGKSQDDPDRSLFVQKTKNQTQLIIPDLEPSEAMYFAASRSYNPSTPSQTFRFFETIEDFYFCTDEFFIKRANNLYAEDKLNIEKLFYAPVVDLDAKNVEAQFNRIEDLQVLSKGIDTSTDLTSGAYVNRVIQVDLLKKRLTDSMFDFSKTSYVDMTGKPREIKDNPHTEKFRKDTFKQENARTFMVFKDYNGDGDSPSNIKHDQRFADIVHNRVSYYHHLHNTNIMAQLKGRLDLRPGQIIMLEIKALDGVDSVISMNDTLSGRYMIKSTNHKMTEGTLHTTINIVKFDHSGQEELIESETADIGVNI